MSGAIQKIDKSILDTARSDLSYAQNMIIILCILTGEVGMPSEKYIDFFYYSLSGQGLGLNRPGDTSKKEFNKALQELLDSGHCIETRGGLQFYEEMFTADRADKERMKQADTFKEVLKELADKCEQSDNSDRNEIDDDMGVIQYVKHSFALDVKANDCEGIVVYNVANGTCRVLKGSTLAPITNCVTSGGYCTNLQADRANNSDKLQGITVISDVQLKSMTRCLEFITGTPTNTKNRTVHNSGYTLNSVVNTKALYDMYIASGKSVEGLGIPEENQFRQAQAVKPVVTTALVKQAATSVLAKSVVSLPNYSYSVGDTLIVKGDDYCGKVEYTGSGWKILAGSICGKRGANLSEEDADFLKNLGLTKQVDFTTRMFNSDITVSTFQQAHALLAHQYDDTIDTFVYDYTETLQPLANVLTDSVSIRAMLSDGKSKRYSKLFEIEVDE